MSAGSSDSILFVAMMTLTSPRSSKPSSWLSSSSIVRWISRSPPEVESYLVRVRARARVRVRVRVRARARVRARVRASPSTEGGSRPTPRRP